MAGAAVEIDAADFPLCFTSSAAAQGAPMRDTGACSAPAEAEYCPALLAAGWLQVPVARGLSWLEANGSLAGPGSQGVCCRDTPGRVGLAVCVGPRRLGMGGGGGETGLNQPVKMLRQA